MTKAQGRISTRRLKDSIALPDFVRPNPALEALENLPGFEHGTRTEDMLAEMNNLTVKHYQTVPDDPTKLSM